VKVGVLALQGDFEAHAKALGEEAGVVLVRRPGQLDGLSALVLPGGESTTLLKLLALEGLDDAIVSFAQDGGVILGTCAGAILLARDVRSPAQPSLGLLDAVIERNSYGRQVDSFVGEAEATPEGAAALGPEPLPAVFIRAPRFLSVGPSVKVWARHGSDPVLVRQGNVLAATFHPELTADRRLHRWLVEAGESAQSRFSCAAGHARR
jgi:5'-phosphate synthase pdxT subunit